MTTKILVVEDDEPILDLMDLMIRRLGYEPVLVADGLLGLELAKKDPPALILLDIMMMPIDGWEFLTKLRLENNQKEIPVIIFSASPLVEEKMAQINDPNLGVLHKPVSFAELKAGIGRYLK
jgi:DNA-binding response OmpR family regulator